MLLIFGAKISGSHYNPAITAAFMFRRDSGKFSRSLGFAYIIFQLAGGLAGGVVSYFLTLLPSQLGLDDNTYIPNAIVAETLGTFFVTFLYLT